MAVNDIKLGAAGAEALIPAFGRTLTMGWLPLSRDERTASGRGVQDIIAKKHTFTLNYSAIDEDELVTILGYYALDASLSLIVTQVAGNTTYTVLMAPFDQSRILAFGTGLWGNVVLNFEEV